MSKNDWGKFHVTYIIGERGAIADFMYGFFSAYSMEVKKVKSFHDFVENQMGIYNIDSNHLLILGSDSVDCELLGEFAKNFGLNVILTTFCECRGIEETHPNIRRCAPVNGDIVIEQWRRRLLKTLGRIMGWKNAFGS